MRSYVVKAPAATSTRKSTATSWTSRRSIAVIVVSLVSLLMCATSQGRWPRQWRSLLSQMRMMSHMGWQTKEDDHCSNFYILPAHFRIFGQFEIGMKYGMSNSETGQKGLYPDRFCILSGYPIFINSVYSVFTTMCVVVAMNLLYLLSVGLWVATICVWL